MKSKCPQCRQDVVFKGNPHRPFCSNRCRLMDLGKWVEGEYRIPVEDLYSDSLDEEESQDSYPQKH
jgi:uncharacterized protein